MVSVLIKLPKIVLKQLYQFIFFAICDISGVIKIAKRFKLRVIEDAAEALGSL